MPILNLKKDIKEDQKSNKLSLQPKTSEKELLSFRPVQVEMLKYLNKYYLGSQEDIRTELNISSGIFVFDILIEELIKLDYVTSDTYENKDNEKETNYYITKSGTKYLMDIGEI